MPTELQKKKMAKPLPHGSHEVSCPRCGGTGKVQADGISIGDRFREARSNLGLTQIDAASRLSITRSQLANVEADRSRPGLDVLILAADVFGVTIDYLLAR